MTPQPLKLDKKCAQVWNPYNFIFFYVVGFTKFKNNQISPYKFSGQFQAATKVFTW